MLNFKNEKTSYNTVVVKMSNKVLKEAVTAFKEIRHGDESTSDYYEYHNMKQEMQENILEELESLLEYEDKIEKVLIGFNEEELDYTRFVELKLKHEMKDEFEHLVILEECTLVSED